VGFPKRGVSVQRDGGRTGSYPRTHIVRVVRIRTERARAQAKMADHVPKLQRKVAYSGRPPVGPQEPPRPMVNGRAIKGFDELALREALAASEP